MANRLHGQANGLAIGLTTVPAIVAAGNFLIPGAASDIIIRHAEKHEATLGFFEFVRIGIPLGFVNLLIYWAWLRYGYG